MDRQELNDIKQMAEPLLEYLETNHHPCVKIIISSNFIELVDVIGLTPVIRDDNPLRIGKEVPKVHTLKNCKTCELVKELKTREGVEAYVADPGEVIKFKQSGPAIVLVVID